MTAHVDVQLIDGLGLPYQAGAEGWLQDEALDPVFHAAWQGFLALFPGQTLQPLFDELPVEQLADLVDGARIAGEEPPDPFVWFTLACADADADGMVAALLALPMVVSAARRPRPQLASIVSYGTNPRVADETTRQILPAPLGVDAIYAWQVPGGVGSRVRVADLEYGWRLDHEDLITASITPRSVAGVPTAKHLDHGTGVAGIVVGGDNGVGSVGIVPDAALELITVTRPDPRHGTANAVAVAAAALEPGDILLLEIGLNFYARERPEDEQGDILVEFDPAVQLQIRLATGRGITVIEPAGNGQVDLDRFPFLAHTRPESPTFSGAIVVGSAEDHLQHPSGDWKQVSSHGSRVDCFAAGWSIDAPSAEGTSSYQVFGGTSGASAIVAGVAASVQGMLKAAGRDGLRPADLRRLFRTTMLGTPPASPLDRIGVMPDLRRLTRALGLHRILPVGAAAIGGNALLMVHLDAENRMVRRHFTLLTGWGQPVPTPTEDGSASPFDTFELTPAQPAVNSTDETEPVPRLVHDAFFSGPWGIHHMWWDSANESGNVSAPIAPRTAAAQGHALAAVRASMLGVVLAAINPQGRLVVLTGDPQHMYSTTSAPMEIDSVSMYRRLAGPTMISRGTGLVDVVAIEDGGALNWYSGTFSEVGPLFSGPITESSAAGFDPGARPALISTGSLLLTAAVAVDGSLRVASIDPVLVTMDVPVRLESPVPIAPLGPVALGRTATHVVAMAVDYQNTVRAATRPIAGGPWTRLEPLLSPIGISPLGGVTLVSIDLGVMAIVVGADGAVCSALSVDGLLWSLLVPLP